MKLSGAAERRIEEVETGFPSFLGVYDARGPFTRAGQLENHEATLRRWRELGGGPVAALRDEAFIISLYRTLRAWGIGVRGSRLRPLPEFWQALLAQEDRIADLAGATISDIDLLARGVDARVWGLIERLDIIENEARIVALTKTLHHILPRLVVPIDRAYTGRFFGWSPMAMQTRQRERFLLAFTAFNRIATAADLEAQLGSGWRSSPAKLIDNAIVGYCIDRLPSPVPHTTAPTPPRTRRTSGGKYEPLRVHLSHAGGSVELSFAEIDVLVGGLPPSSRSYREWWANTARSPQGSAWMKAGKRVDFISMDRQVVRFAGPRT